MKQVRPMKLSYVPRHNIAYLYLLDKTVEVETVRVTDELDVDVAPDGAIYGIELLNASEQLPGLLRHTLGSR